MYQWRGFCQSGHLGKRSLLDSNLLYLGNHRFCAAKFYAIWEESAEEFSDNVAGMALVLTGMEIVNGRANKAKLRMIKHKTRTYMYEGSSIQSVF
jgi:hypothetical protein